MKETIVLTETEKKFNDTSFPEFTSNWLSRLFFVWMNPLFDLGLKRPLEEEDLWKVNLENQSCQWSEKIESGWNSQVEKCNLASETEFSSVTPSLFNVLWDLLAKDLLLLGILRVSSDLMHNFSPLLIRALVNFVRSSGSNNPDPAWQGYLYATGLLLIQLLASLAMTQFLQGVFTMSVMVRAGLYGSIFKKFTRLSSAARQEFNSGKVTNIMTTDVSRIEGFIVMANTASNTGDHYSSVFVTWTISFSWYSFIDYIRPLSKKINEISSNYQEKCCTHYRFQG
jgi:ATP-binding cassette, subfamily C (CFTR/MRP), member 1